MYNIKEFNDSLFAYTKCFIEKCKKELKKVKKIRTEWENNQRVLYNDYKYGKINYEEFLEENYKIDDKYFNSLLHINLTKCKLDKCYDETKKYLDEMLKRLNYPIKEKYDVNELIEILKLNRKKFFYSDLEVKNIIDINNNIKLLNECSLKNCENDIKTLNKLREKWINTSTILLNKYMDNKLKYKEYKAKIKIIDDNYYKSLEFKKVGKCKLTNCNDLTKIQLDYLSDLLNYSKNNKYNINDYIKLTRLNTNKKLSSLVKK
jgi:hypothetical protein